MQIFVMVTFAKIHFDLLEGLMVKTLTIVIFLFIWIKTLVYLLVNDGGEHASPAFQTILLSYGLLLIHGFIKTLVLEMVPKIVLLLNLTTHPCLIVRMVWATAEDKLASFVLST